MGLTPTARRTRQRLAVIGALLVVVFAALGLVVTLIGRGGGGQHHCPAGSKPSDCSYPVGPWHWGAGILIGSLIGILAFLAWLAIQRHSRY